MGPMIHTDYLLDQIKRFLERLVQLRRAVQQGARAQAADELEELLRELDELGAGASPEQRTQLAPVKAQVHAELGLLMGSAGDAEEALGHLEVARRQLQPLVDRPGAEGRLVELYASILLNSGATHAAARDARTARARLDEALERIGAPPAAEKGSGAATSLRVAALQNRAMLSQQEKAFDAARDDLGQALALAEAAMAHSPQTFGAMAIDLHHRLTVVYRQEGRVEAALESARNAVRVAEGLAGEEWGPFAALYVRAKMVLADLCFDAGALSEGEDQIFEVIESVPELIDPVLNGIDAYLALWRKSDEALAEGGLPRDEVGESLAELMAAFDARRPEDGLRAAVWARYDLTVNGDRGAAEQVLASGLPEDADARVAALREQLRAELGERVRE
jgi:tetratricopeptide (TPR) repeat protein